MNIMMLVKANEKVEQKIFCVKKDDSPSEIYFKGIISQDYGVSAKDLRSAFSQANGDDIHLHINSPGGDVIEAREMQAVIASYSGKVTAMIEGIAASAATIVSLSCAEVQIMAGSRFMIHNAMTIAFGNKSDMKSAYDLLNGFDDELANEYASKSNQDKSVITAWMDDETWFTAERALQVGFVDKVNSNKQNAQAFSAWDLSAYSKAPENMPVIEEPIKQEPEPSFIENEHRDRQAQRLKLAAHNPIG